MSKIINTQDWLGIDQVFYNEMTGAHSQNINNVIDYSQFEIDPEGLINYLAYGYCVFGKTPVRGIHFLRQNQSLTKNSNGKYSVIDNVDSCRDLLENVTSEKDVWDLLQQKTQKICNAVKDERILVPTSGGYDSRLLNYFCPTKDKILACTYGISDKQDMSFETVHAKELCKRLHINWNRIELGKYHDYLDQWNELYGTSTHAHGMYHLEFYSKIRANYGVMPLLSGIIGDLWAGSPTTFEPKSPDDLIHLGYNHGLAADTSQCLLKCRNEILQSEFEKERYLFKNERYRVLYLVRTKIILLSYLMTVPKFLGFSPYSPFIDQDVAMSMLTIEPSRWRGRIWQKEFMINHELDVEYACNNKSYRNDLDFNAMLLSPLQPLNIKLLSRLFKCEYLEWINRTVRVFSPMTYLRHWIIGLPKVGRLVKLLGARDTALCAYSAYLVLKPLEQLLLRSEQCKEYAHRG